MQGYDGTARPPASERQGSGHVDQGLPRIPVSLSTGRTLRNQHTGQCCDIVKVLVPSRPRRMVLDVAQLHAVTWRSSDRAEEPNLEDDLDDIPQKIQRSRVTSSGRTGRQIEPIPVSLPCGRLQRRAGLHRFEICQSSLKAHRLIRNRFRLTPAHAGRNHAGTGLTQRCHGEESGRNRGKCQEYCKPAVWGQTEYSPNAPKPLVSAFR
jgi:hypothetical protein